MKLRLITILLAMLALPAGAADLDQAKAAGLIGEQANGYLGIVVPNPDPDIQKLVDTINEKRKARYQKIAAQNDIDPFKVEKLAGGKAIEKTAPGHYIKLPGENWRKK